MSESVPLLENIGSRLEQKLCCVDMAISYGGEDGHRSVLIFGGGRCTFGKEFFDDVGLPGPRSVEQGRPAKEVPTFDVDAWVGEKHLDYAALAVL